MRYFSEIKLIGRASILFLEIRIRVGALECKHTYRSFLRDVSSVAYAWFMNQHCVVVSYPWRQKQIKNKG